MLAVETHELTKDYPVGFWRRRAHRALDRLTLDVEPGEVFGFLGPNGAGKTTTLKLLMGLVFPTAGEARLLGRPLGDVSARRRIGYLPENPYLYDYLTAEELLGYFAGLFGYGPAARRSRTARLLDDLGVGAERRLPLRKFSKGMLQRVGIAQALINDPELVIFDEPMSGLDPLGRRDVRALILSLRDRGCTVFFSSHVLADAEALCSRVAILAGGRLVTAGRVADIVAFRVHGWELVASGVSDTLAAGLARQARRIVRIGEGRYTIELPVETSPDRVLAELTANGATLVSLNPLRDTLEDYFVRHVVASRAPVPEEASAARAAGHSR
jgi:ABC-2 type transport system ATP-binding protein